MAFSEAYSDGHVMPHHHGPGSHRGHTAHQPMHEMRHSHIHGRHKRGAAPLGNHTGHAIRHGGHTGHANGFPGPYAAHPHDGHHTGRPAQGSRHAGSHMQGGGFQAGPFAASPFHGKVARRTGYKGTHGDYAAAGPLQGFVTQGKGHFTPEEPAGY